LALAADVKLKDNMCVLMNPPDPAGLTEDNLAMWLASGMVSKEAERRMTIKQTIYYETALTWA
jgi:hypothetical protein